MSRNAPDGHFRVFIFSESKFYATYNGENHFQIKCLAAVVYGHKSLFCCCFFVLFCFVFVFLFFVVFFFLGGGGGF